MVAGLPQPPGWPDQTAVSLKPPGAILGLGVDAKDGSHLRVGTDDGFIYESRDSGDTWTRIARLDAPAKLFYRFTFESNDLDHIIAGTAVDGAFTSFDGGNSWGNPLQHTNVFNIVIAPSDPNIAYAMGIDLGDLTKRIYVSRDAGITLSAVFTAGSLARES